MPYIHRTAASNRGAAKVDQLNDFGAYQVYFAEDVFFLIYWV
jgi:hypothetical protein